MKICIFAEDSPHGFGSQVVRFIIASWLDDIKGFSDGGRTFFHCPDRTFPEPSRYGCEIFRYQIEQVCANIFEIRGAILEEALRKGYIAYEDNDSRRMPGAVLMV